MLFDSCITCTVECVATLPAVECALLFHCSWARSLDSFGKRLSVSVACTSLVLMIKAHDQLYVCIVYWTCLHRSCGTPLRPVPARVPREGPAPRPRAPHAACSCVQELSCGSRGSGQSGRGTPELLVSSSHLGVQVSILPRLESPSDTRDPPRPTSRCCCSRCFSAWCLMVGRHRSTRPALFTDRPVSDRSMPAQVFRWAHRHRLGGTELATLLS